MKLTVKTSAKFILASLMLLSSCSGGDYIKDANSVTVHGEKMTTKVTILDSEIIHIRKELNSSDAKVMKNVVTLLEPQDVKWSVRQSGENVVVKTAEVELSINPMGEVSYRSKSGKEYTHEVEKNSYIAVDSSQMHSVSQAFAACDDEAIYGLGQFQSGRMDWRNASIRMMQSNQEIASPMMMSTKGYGIFWNNYGVTDFNYPDNELKLIEVVDEELNIKRGKFTPSQSGTYNFMAISETPAGNRQFGSVVVTLDADTVIHYKTMWFPDSFSGEIELTAGREYDVQFQDTGAKVEGRLLYNEPDHGRSVFSSFSGEAIDYYFVGGGDPKSVVEGYGRLVGRAPMLSKAAYGFWQCREAYSTQAQLLESAHGYRSRNIPVDYIVQDWDYWPKGMKGPHWDRSRYPDPAAMTAELKDLNLRLMVSVWPQVLDQANLAKYGLDTEIMGSGFVDFYKEENQPRYYRMLSDSMFHFGVKSIWLDGSEPANTINPTCETDMGLYKEVDNIYSLLVTKSMYEGRREEFPRERVVNLTRSSFPGQQRYGAIVWSGDVEGSFEQFAEQISAGLNYSMTGMPYWTTDIGGFFRDSKSGYPAVADQFKSDVSRELLNRWFQFGAFCPIFRIHGFRTETEIWKYDDNYEAMARKFIDLRYRLMPYIYSMAYNATEQGGLLMSPLAYQYPEDRMCWDIDDQMLFGESIIACPITEYGVREREVYLPEGDWYDLWSSERVAGGRKMRVAAPLDTMPIYVKAGSIIPWGAKVQYATEPTDELTTLKIFAGGDAEFRLYYDDCESYDYEDGKYTTIDVEYSESAQTLTLSSSVDGYLELATNPISFKIEMVGGSTKCNDATFDGKQTVIKL